MPQKRLDAALTFILESHVLEDVRSCSPQIFTKFNLVRILENSEKVGNIKKKSYVTETRQSLFLFVT